MKQNFDNLNSLLACATNDDISILRVYICPDGLRMEMEKNSKLEEQFIGLPKATMLALKQFFSGLSFVTYPSFDFDNLTGLLAMSGTA